MKDVKDYLRCEDCGKSGDDVIETHCPYAEDIYGDIIEVTLCGDCIHERCMDI